MQITGIDEDQLVDKIVDRLVVKLLPKFDVAVDKHEKSDELLDQKGVYTGILHCTYITFHKHYLSDPTFPHQYKGNRMVFSRKAVEKWIDVNGKKYEEE